MVVDLHGAQALEAGREILAREQALIQPVLEVGMSAKCQGELVRQRDDRRAPGLAPEPLLADRVPGAAADAAVPSGRLVDRALTLRYSAELDRDGLLQRDSPSSPLSCCNRETVKAFL